MVLLATFQVCVSSLQARCLLPGVCTRSFPGASPSTSNSRGLVSAPRYRKNPHQVDLRTARVFLEVAELHRKHLGGQLLFGPHGLLYVILGDGMITLDDMEEMDGLR